MRVLAECKAGGQEEKAKAGIMAGIWCKLQAIQPQNQESERARFKNKCIH